MLLTMDSMFSGATSFDSNISNWNVSNVTISAIYSITHLLIKILADGQLHLLPNYFQPLKIIPHLM